MPFFIGIILALAVGAFARWFGLDRDRAFYPTVMIVIAGLYSLFAVIAGSPDVLITELTIGAGFIALALAGFKRSLWFVVAALAVHGLLDLFHPHAFHNPGVPVWYPDFCFAYDVAAAVFLGWHLRQLQSAPNAADSICQMPLLTLPRQRCSPSGPSARSRRNSNSMIAPSLVSSARETNAEAIAINEQRFAANIAFNGHKRNFLNGRQRMIAA